MFIHPSADELAAFSCGRLDEGAISQIESHLGLCPDCRGVLKALPTDRLTALLRGPTGYDPTSTGDTVRDLPAGLVNHPRYRVLAKLGEGGMGVVYRAEHRLMKRIVALKVIGARLASSPAAVARFRREMEALAKLDHPNVAAALDADDVDGQLVLVEEYVEGADLAQVVRERGPVPAARACAWVRQAALALQYAHERGLIHRDIKPANLMLTTAGGIKVLDFGLASLHGEPEFVTASDAPTTASRSLTDFGQGVGTANYVAPEQVRDALTADARSDVYSLGCTLFFLLMGHTTGEKGIDRSDVSYGFAGVLKRMTAVNPAERYQTMAEVAAALTPFTGTERGRWSKWAVAVGAVVLAFVVALAAIGMSRSTGGQKQTDDSEPKGNHSRFGSYKPLSLKDAATADTTRGLYGTPTEVLIFPDWGRLYHAGVPFDVPEPGGKPNAIVLRSGWLGTYPLAASVPCGVACKAVHLLSGVAGGGWYPGNGVVNGTVAVVVRLHYAGGGTEDHELYNAIHFANFRGVHDVPGSVAAFALPTQPEIDGSPGGVNQVRYLAVVPKSPTVVIDSIEFLKGERGDISSPIILAVTAEQP